MVATVFALVHLLSICRIIDAAKTKQHQYYGGDSAHHSLLSVLGSRATFLAGFVWPGGIGWCVTQPVIA